MRKLLLIALVAMCGVQGLAEAKAAPEEMRRLEQNIRSYRSTRSRLERQRAYLATSVMKRERDIHMRLAMLEREKGSLIDIDEELSDVNSTINEFTDRESRLMSKVKEGRLGVRSAVRRAVERETARQHGRGRFSFKEA